jgi:uncharacterized damage-inducible protein DinB
MKNQIQSSEYNPYYSAYINSVPEGDIIGILTNQMEETLTAFQGISEEQALFRYASDKWSIKEALGHIADTERVMGYRLVAIARGETASLPGFDDMVYVQNAKFNGLSIQDLLQNFAAVRESTLHLLKTLPSEAWTRIGSANGSPMSVRAIAYVIAGHERHHRLIVKERYIQSEQYPR